MRCYGKPSPLAFAAIVLPPASDARGPMNDHNLRTGRPAQARATLGTSWPNAGTAEASGVGLNVGSAQTASAIA